MLHRRSLVHGTSADRSLRSYTIVNNAIRTSLRTIIRRYVSDPDVILDLLEEFHAVIWGNAALAFFLRDLSVLDKDLDISVGLRDSNALKTVLQLRIPMQRVWTHPTGPRQGRVVVHCFRLGNRRYLKLHCSPDTTPTLPIVQSECTVFMNFVSTIGAGCAYPALTLRRTGMSLPYWFVPRHGVRRRLIILVLKGFRFSRHSRDLLPPTWTPPLTFAPGGGCLEKVYLCPYQSRYFGDLGSLVFFFDAAHMDLDWLQRSHQPPFGVTTVWRWTVDYTTCNSLCVSGDRYLRTGYGSVPMVVTLMPSFNYGPCFQGIDVLYV